MNELPPLSSDKEYWIHEKDFLPSIEGIAVYKTPQGKTIVWKKCPTFEMKEGLSYWKVSLVALAFFMSAGLLLIPSMIMYLFFYEKFCELVSSCSKSKWEVVVYQDVDLFKGHVLGIKNQKHNASYSLKLLKKQIEPTLDLNNEELKCMAKYHLFQFFMNHLTKKRIEEYAKKIVAKAISNSRASVVSLTSNPIPPAEVAIYEKKKQAYLDLIALVPQSITLSPDLETLYTVTIEKIIGEGGSKTAYALSNKKVLLLPNITAHCPPETISHWERMIDEEIAHSEFYKKLGIHTLSPKKTWICTANDLFLPVIICDSFESLQKSGHYIIDCKNQGSSTYSPNKFPLVPQNDPDIDFTDWKDAFRPLINDITMLHRLGLILPYDSLNLVVNNTDKHNPVKNICLFLFDFSSKSHLKPIPQVKNCSFNEINYQRLHKDIEYLIDKVLTVYIDFPSCEAKEKMQAMLCGWAIDYAINQFEL